MGIQEAELSQIPVYLLTTWLINRAVYEICCQICLDLDLLARVLAMESCDQQRRRLFGFPTERLTSHGHLVLNNHDILKSFGEGGGGLKGRQHLMKVSWWPEGS